MAIMPCKAMTGDLNVPFSEAIEEMTSFRPPGFVQVAIMPCKAMADDLSVPFSAAITCIEWCKTNFENIASMGGRQRTGIYTTAWGSDSASDGATLSATIRKVGERKPFTAFYTRPGMEHGSHACVTGCKPTPTTITSSALYAAQHDQLLHLRR